MSFINTRLSECVAYGFTGGPEWSTLIVDMDNGREQRNGQWMYPKHRYSAQYLNLNPDGRDDILAAFHAAKGRLHCFRFRDWNDYTATAQPLITVAGVTYLGKRYALGAQTADRLIQAPVSATLSGEFDVWVRFDSDYNAFAIGNWNAHTADIELVEVRR